MSQDPGDREATDRRFAGHDPKGGADTAGTPWQGRTLSGTGFDDDSGAPDTAVRAAVAASANVPEHESAVVAAIATARLLVPIVAVASDTTTNLDTGLVTDAASDMAAVTLTAPDGTTALPVFTGVDTLTAWDPRARPVPVTAARAAAAAVNEQCSALVLDPAPPGVDGAAAQYPSYTLRSSMMWALAEGRAWVPAHLDDVVRSAVRDGVAAEPAIEAHRLEPGPGGELALILAVPKTATPAAVEEAVARIGQRLGSDPDVRVRLDGVRIDLRPV